MPKDGVIVGAILELSMKQEHKMELLWVLVGVLGFIIGWFIPSRGFLDYQDPEYPEAHSIGD